MNTHLGPPVHMQSRWCRWRMCQCLTLSGSPCLWVPTSVWCTLGGTSHWTQSLHTILGCSHSVAHSSWPGKKSQTNPLKKFRGTYLLLMSGFPGWGARPKQLCPDRHRQKMPMSRPSQMESAFVQSFLRSPDFETYNSKLYCLNAGKCILENFRYPTGQVSQLINIDNKNNWIKNQNTAEYSSNCGFSLNLSCLYFRPSPELGFK